MSKGQIVLSNQSESHVQLDERRISIFFEKIQDDEDISFEEINVVFMNSNDHTALNFKYLNHNYATDILTFDLSIDNAINSDIYINTEVANDNAKEYNVSFENELYRLIIHGLLHMSGYQDSTDEERVRMREKEEYYLNVSCETL